MEKKPGKHQKRGARRLSTTNNQAASAATAHGTASVSQQSRIGISSPIGNGNVASATSSNGNAWKDPNTTMKVLFGHTTPKSKTPTVAWNPPDTTTPNSRSTYETPIERSTGNLIVAWEFLRFQNELARLDSQRRPQSRAERQDIVDEALTQSLYNLLNTRQAVRQVMSQVASSTEREDQNLTQGGCTRRDEPGWVSWVCNDCKKPIYFGEDEPPSHFLSFHLENCSGPRLDDGHPSTPGNMLEQDVRVPTETMSSRGSNQAQHRPQLPAHCSRAWVCNVCKAAVYYGKDEPPSQIKAAHLEICPGPGVDNAHSMCGCDHVQPPSNPPSSDGPASSTLNANAREFIPTAPKSDFADEVKETGTSHMASQDSGSE